MSYKIEKNGWVYIHIEGTPKERGRQHGKHVGKQLEEFIRTSIKKDLFDFKGQGTFGGFLHLDFGQKVAKKK